MTINPQVPTPSKKPQTPRWRRKRYWFLAVVLLMLLAMSPNFGVWYRRHQMIQHLFGGYGKQYAPADRPFVLFDDSWPRKLLDADHITPFDRVKFADLELTKTSDLKWITHEKELLALTVHLPMPDGSDDSGFEVLAGLTLLEELKIIGVSLRGDGLKHIKRLPNLTYLGLKMTGSSPGITELRGHPTIKLLVLIAPPLPAGEPSMTSSLPGNASDIVHAIREMPRLESLSFIGSPEASAFESLSTNPRLTYVTIEAANLDSVAINSLARIKQLKTLVLWKCPIEAGAFASFSGHPLEELRFKDMPLSELLRGVETLPELRKLDGSDPESDEEIAMLVKCLPKLESLALGDTAADQERYKPNPVAEPIKIARGKITDEGIKHLVKLSNLRELALGCNQITDASIEVLSQIKQLKVLYLSGTPITDQGYRRLEKLLPETEIHPPYGAIPSNEHLGSPPPSDPADDSKRSE